MYKSHYVCINQPSIRLNKTHNISVKVYVCARGVIYLMYWYVYFNLFQDLILRLWPRNQYLHLWSTTFNQFCPRLFSAMDCLRLDTCKPSSIALSFFLLAAFCVAVQWEVTGHSNPRLAAGHHTTVFPGSLLSWPPFSAPSSGFHLPALLVTGSYMALIHDKQSTQRMAEGEKHMQNKCKWPLVLSWASSLSMLLLSVSPFLAYLLAETYDLIPMKYRCHVHSVASSCPHCKIVFL